MLLRARPALAPMLVGASILAAAALAGTYAVRARAWAVMTDELQVARLATSIAETLSPVPAIHGAYYGALSQLYPLLLAPFYGTMSAANAEVAAHALNALLLASAAVPAYFLGRSVGGSAAAGCIAAALTVLTPWLVLASTLLTENAAYPAFVWAVFLCHRALARPSPRRDAAALAGLALAFFARTQLFVLALAFPVALLLHETAFAVALRGSRSVGAAARKGVARAVAAHRLLVVAYGLGAVLAVLLAVRGSLGRVVGNYAVSFGGDLLPAGLWRSAAAHLDHVVVGAGILPFVLAASWALAAVVRPERKEAHAFALFLLVLVPVLTFEVASFDLRFTPNQFIQDRYLFYLVPLFAVGAAAWLVQPTQRRLRILTLAVAAGAFVGLLQLASFNDKAIIFWAAPGGAVHPAIAAVASPIGLSADVFLRIATVVAAVAAALVALRAPRGGGVVLAVAIAGFGAYGAAYVLHQYSDPVMTREPAGAARGWIDRAVPAGRSVALVPSPLADRPYWWEAELWNKDVDRALRVGGGRTFTPFPADKVNVDYRSGTLRGAQPSSYLVLASREVRFHLAGSKRVADGRPLTLMRVRRPYRLAWATRGLTLDGWTRPSEAATIRLYGHGSGGRRVVTVTLASSRFAPRPLDFALAGGGSIVRGGVDPGGARPPVRLSVCVPAGGHADATITTSGATYLPGGRIVALHLDALAVRDTGAPCRAS
jgi:hypothetical protein